mgnify:CR=1 FL=1
MESVPERSAPAFTHSSWAGDRSTSYERLEFLGDSVVGLAVAHHAFEHFPHLSEGKLSEIRAGVVNARVLAEVATEIGLGDCLFLGKGEANGNVKARPGAAPAPDEDFPF